MPFDNVHGFPPVLRPSGVAAGFNAAADVARATDQRQVDESCSAGRHVTECRPTGAGADKTSHVDVGEGWRWLRPDEILREGDEYYSVNHCCFNATGYCGLPAHHEGRAGPYRRRVTPEEPPLGAYLDEENNELRQQVVTLTAEVERLREDLFRAQLTPKERKAVAFAEKHFVYFKNQARTLRGLLKRLGGGE